MINSWIPRWSVTAVFALAAAAVATPPADAQRGSREHSVIVTVLDRKDAPVKGLGAADFTVREDGVAREILRVEADSAPLQVALLADDSQSAQPIIAELRQGLTAFVTAMITERPGSEIAIVSFGERPTRLADYTGAPAVLTRAIDRVFARSGAGSYLLDAIIETANAQRKKEAPRPAIVATFVEDGPEFSGANRSQVETAVRGAGAALWTIVLQTRGVQATSTERRERDAVAGDVTAASGGDRRVVLSSQGIEPALTAAGAVLRSQYVITYARPDTLVPPKSRQVTAKGDGNRTLASRWVSR